MTAHIVDGYTEMPYTQFVQMIEFLHDSLHSRIQIAEVYASSFECRMDRPYKSNIAGFRFACQFAQVVLGDQPHVAFLVGYGCRVIFAPFTCMVRIGFRTIYKHIHFVSFAIVQQVKPAFCAIRMSIESFYNSAILSMGIILESGGLQVVSVSLF